MPESLAWPRSLELVEVHCQGEIGKVIVGGAPEIPGVTLLDRMNHINQVDGSLRRFVTSEPRASAQMSVNLLVAPAPGCRCRLHRAAVGPGAPDVRQQMHVRGDRAARDRPRRHEGAGDHRAPGHAGRPRGRARNARAAAACRSASTTSPPSWRRWTWSSRRSAGGRSGPTSPSAASTTRFVDADQLGIAIEPNNARPLAESGIRLKEDLARQVTVHHPALPGLDEIAYVMFRGADPDGAVRTCTTLKPGRVDRSPCGTGSSANLAVLHARGQVKAGDARRSRSMIGGEFTVEATGETTVGSRPAILPRITGSAWIYGAERLRLDAGGPFPDGFALSATWGPQLG
jgi:proline racemase